jgi:hypothetical protein
MSIYPCSTHVDPITSVAVYILIAAEIKHVAWLYQGYIPPYPTMLLNLIMLVTSLSWLFSLSPATCAIERPCREVPWQRPGADHGEDIRIWEPSCLTWISMIDFSLQDCGGLYKKNKFW